MSSDKGEDPYMAVPSQTQPEANGKPWNVTIAVSLVHCHLWQGRGKGGIKGKGRVCVIEIYGRLAASS